jgi:phosphoglycerate kinase
MIQSFLKSKNDTNSIDRGNNTIIEILNNNKTEIVLPDDVLIKVNDRVENIDINKLSENDSIVDIGFKTINKYKDIISNSDYILWNGPMGIFEIDETNKGTAAIAKAIEMNQNAYTVAGGGSTLQAIKEFTNRDKFSHVSTGGGAFMEYIENGTLPGIEAIIHNKLN